MTSSINQRLSSLYILRIMLKVCPVDSSPQLIMKSLKNNDIETAIQYGLLDTVESGLYTYVCPSKIEIDAIFEQRKKHYTRI